MRHRALVLLQRLLCFLAAGLCYAVFCTVTGLALPCPFHLVTGLQCPGCGVTRMCLALLRLDFSAAWQANPGLLLLCPVLLLLFARLSVQYLRTGDWRPSRRVSLLIWAILIYLLVYSVLRNLPFF